MSFKIKAQSKYSQVLDRWGDDIRERRVSVHLYGQLLIIFLALRPCEHMAVDAFMAA